MRRFQKFIFATILATICGVAHADANAEFDALYERSKALSAGSPVANTLFDLAQKQSTEPSAAFKNMGHLANYLADDFTLISTLQHTLVRERCDSEGLDISAYLNALDTENEPDAAIAKKIYARLGISYGPVWEKIQPQAKEGLDGIIGGFAASLDIGSSDYCRTLAADPTRTAQRLRYASFRQSRSQILRAISP